MEHLTILHHATNRLAKTWQADGTITPYDNAKYFTLKKASVSDIRTLSAKLSILEGKPGMCLIRGSYMGNAHAAAVDTEYKKGKVRRVLDVFEDRPLHTCLIEVDNFEPITADPVLDPVDCIEEYIFACLPEAFWSCSYHWQLSNSAGAPGKDHLLKAHIWFWLETPYTGAQLRAWSKTLPPDTLDASVFNPVQVHYTSAPVMAEGVSDPIPVRSGFVEGIADDAVALSIDEAVIAAAQVAEGRVTRQATLRNAIDEDPIVHLLGEKGMVKANGPGGQLFIECPLSENHTSESCQTSTVYYPPNTGGFSRGAFVCQHDHCRDAAQAEFQRALGYDPVLDEFTDLDVGGTYSAGDTLEGDFIAREIPEAKHLTTDLANASRIMNHFKKRLFVSTDRWYAWTGTHWAQDDGEVYSFSVRLSQIIHEEADSWDRKCAKKTGVTVSPDFRSTVLAKAKKGHALTRAESYVVLADTLRKWAKSSEMRSTIEAAMHLAKKMLAIPEKMLDRDPWAFNCPNGTVDLRTGELRPHNPDDYITHCAPIAYDPEARSDVWERALKQITREDTREHAPVAEFLQRWFGYCATGSTREQKFVVHYGAGRNGKSTVLDMVAEVLNGYAGTAAPGLLVSSSNDRHPTEIADLFGRRMVTAHETGDGGVLREDFVKQATGSDKIKARYMRADFFEFDPTHKIQLLTNHKPVIRGQDAGIWGRVLLVPYTARFGSEAEVDARVATALADRTLLDRLKQERSGILNWIVQGAVQWFNDGLNPPDYVLAASQEYQAEQDRILQFISECCEVGEEYETPLAGVFGGLYPAYKEWCAEGGFRALAKNRFSQEITRVVPFAEKYEKKVPVEGGGRRKIMQVKGILLNEP